MQRRNYYVILGVPRGASPETIRAAYRNLAKRYHPDRVGPGGAATFRDVAEAYEVLSDPRRRLDYDDQEDPVVTQTGAGIAAEPMRAGSYRDVEPLIPEGISISRAFHASHPTLEEEWLDWTARHLSGVRLPKSGRAEYLNVHVLLSQDEAATGGILPITVPIVVPCPSCGGTGRDWLYPCGGCGAHGLLREHERFRIRIPTMVRDGTTWELPFAGARVLLRLRIRVAPTEAW